MPVGYVASLYLQSRINPDEPIPDILKFENCECQPGDLVLHISGAVAQVLPTETDDGTTLVVLYTPWHGVYSEYAADVDLLRLLGETDVQVIFSEFADGRAEDVDFNCVKEGLL